MAHANSAAPSQRTPPLPPYMRDGFFVDEMLLETPSPFGYVVKLADIEKEPRSEEPSFKFAHPEDTAPANGDIAGFPFAATGLSKATVGSLSLRSWSKEDSRKLPLEGTSSKESILKPTDSLVLKPFPVREEHPSDDVVVQPPHEEPEVVIHFQPMPVQTWKSRLSNWRHRKKSSAAQSEREALSPGESPQPGMESILEVTRGRSAECVGERHWRWHSDDSPSPRTPRRAINPWDLLQSMPEMILPRVATRHVDLSTSDVTWRLAPLLKRGKVRMRPKFPPPSVGCDFVLDSVSLRVVTEFNGMWRVDSGSKDLFKAISTTLPRSKKWKRRFDGPLRYLHIDSTPQHFRVTTWTAFIQSQEQRPWSGEAVTTERARGIKGEQKMTVQLNNAAIEAQ